MPDIEPMVVTTTEARRLLGGLGKSAFWKYVKTGDIPTFKWLGRTWVRAEDLRSARDAVFAKRPSASAAAPPSAPAPRRSSQPTPR